MGDLSTLGVVAPLAGGVLIGLSASLLLIALGRIAGITGIVSGLFVSGNLGGWRAFFLAGLIAGGAALGLLVPEAFRVDIARSPGAIVAAGLLVGFGARLGGGCTSGHGVCGVSRLSKRSIAATMTFIFTGAVTVFVVTHWFGGAL